MVLPLADLSERGWRLVFFAGLLLLPLVRAVGRHLPESRRFDRQHEEVGMAGHGRRFWLLAASALLLSLFTAPAAQMLNEFLRDEQGFTATRITMFSILTNTPGGIGLVVGGRLADLRGRRLIGAVGVAGGTVLTVAMVLAGGWAMWVLSTAARHHRRHGRPGSGRVRAGAVPHVPAGQGQRDVVFFDAPAVFDFASFADGGPMLRWKPELGTRIGVMPRDGDAADVVWAEMDPCYVFHFLNAWSDGDEVHIDGCRLAHMDIGLEPGEAPALDDGEEPGSFLTRFTVDLTDGSATWERTAERPGDFPRINDDRAGLANRYGYVATFADGRDGDGAFDSITKHNLATGTAEIHDFGPGQITGEAVFAPDPTARSRTTAGCCRTCGMPPPTRRTS